MAKTKGFIQQVSGRPGSGEAKTVFTSGAVSTDLKCAQFFMTMQDRGADIDECRAYAKVGPMMAPDVDWAEIGRVLDTFASR